MLEKFFNIFGKKNKLENNTSGVNKAYGKMGLKVEKITCGKTGKEYTLEEWMKLKEKEGIT